MIIVPARYRALAAFLVLFALLGLSWQSYPVFKAGRVSKAAVANYLQAVSETSKRYVETPLTSSKFGEMGRRVQTLREWMLFRSTQASRLTAAQNEALMMDIERMALAAFPFLQNPSKPQDQTPLESLRKSFIPGSKGIVIPTGKGTFRFACHLVSSLRTVLKSELPIEIMYAGDDDLPAEYRNTIAALGADIKLVDVMTILDDRTLELAHGGWAIKAFAALASTFEEVMLMDADAVWVQKPEMILSNHDDYRATGALLFHDRLLWQGAFKERHEWWEKELEGHTPSATLNNSKVYNEMYAEEGDSGVVVLDKGRLPILVGLLHICWQNTAEVRKISYTRCYGDKETWWFGLELSDAAYAFEEHYGGVIGHTTVKDGIPKVCGFTIAHTDRQDKLLWYNGSILKNKAIDNLAFDVPDTWMVEAIWEKGAKTEHSCMKDGTIRQVAKEHQEILALSIEAAKAVDKKIKGLVDI